MTVPTQPVTVRLADFGGPSIAGVKVTARLSEIDFTADGIIVSTEPVTAETDEDGIAVLEVFPNAVDTGLGTRGTTVEFTAAIPRSRNLRVQAVVPNEACNLVEIMVDETPEGISAAQLAKQQAQAAAAAAGQSALATAADVIQTAADREAVAVDRALIAADVLQTAQDRAQTEEDVLATAADRMATAEDRIQTGLDRVAAAVSAENAENAVAGLSASGGSALIGFIQSGTGAVARTLQAKARESVSVFDFMTSAQIADVMANTGSIDVAPAVQAAVDAMKPSSGSAPSGGAKLKMPKGTYQFNSQVNLYSGIVLEGAGGGTIITNGAGLTSGALLAAASMDGSGQYRFAGVKKLTLQPTGDVWGIQGTASNVLNSVFEDLYIDGPYGIDLSSNSYTQASTVQRILSVGSVEQILKLSGNFNKIDQIDKEGGTGTTTLPYVHTYSAGSDNHGNILSKILVEGSGSVNKVALRIENANYATLLDFWKETNAANGNTIEIVNSLVEIRGTYQTGTVSDGVLSVTSGSVVTISQVNIAADDIDWTNLFSVDSTSHLYIETLYTRRGADQYPVVSGSNIEFGRIVSQAQVQTPEAGFANTQVIDRRGGSNILVNPSFEAGNYGWNFSSAPSLEEYVASEVSLGNMMHVQTSAGGFQIYQNVTIPAALVGIPTTIRYIGKTDGGYIVPVIGGAASLAINRINAGSGFQHITATFTLQTSGSLVFGCWWVGASAGDNLWLDECSLVFGTEASINPAKFGSFELNGSTFTTATAAPTGGTWKRGDVCFNSSPSAGGTPGWVCTTAGTPGTWKAMASLAA